jgi:hypothetical protein
MEEEIGNYENPPDLPLLKGGWGDEMGYSPDA